MRPIACNVSVNAHGIAGFDHILRPTAPAHGGRRGRLDGPHLDFAGIVRDFEQQDAVRVRKAKTLRNA
jgi:hypothetical protein